MDYIIYTTEGSTETPVGNIVENCQILDFIYNSDLTASQSLEKYIAETYSDKSGFNASELKIATRIDENVCASIKEIIKYLQNSTLNDKSVMENVNLLAEYFRL